jgi:hypothetical protein
MFLNSVDMVDMEYLVDINMEDLQIRQFGNWAIRKI